MLSTISDFSLFFGQRNKSKKVRSESFSLLFHPKSLFFPKKGQISNQADKQLLKSINSFFQLKLGITRTPKKVNDHVIFCNGIVIQKILF